MLSYEDVCEELSDNCKKVKKHRDLFLKMAENARSLKLKTVGTILNLNEQVLKVIEMEKEYGF